MRGFFSEVASPSSAFRFVEPFAVLAGVASAVAESTGGFFFFLTMAVRSFT